MSTEQRENLDAILRQSALPVDSDVSEQRRLLREWSSAQPPPADVTVTAAAVGAFPTAEITINRIEPRHVVLYSSDVDVTLDITPGVPHVFQTFYPILDEAAAALDRAGQLLSAHLASTELATGKAILTSGGPGN